MLIKTWEMKYNFTKILFTKHKLNEKLQPAKIYCNQLSTYSQYCSNLSL